VTGPSSSSGLDHSGDAARPKRGFIVGDPLRALASISVVLWHCTYQSLYLSGHPAPPDAGGYSFLAYGRIADLLLDGVRFSVFVFFAISGYLISRPFVHAFVRREPFPSISGYVRNRALRIFPAFWAAFTLILLVRGTLGASFTKILNVYTLWNVTDLPFATEIGQVWTGRLEVIFYLLLPVAAFLIGLLGWRLKSRGRLWLMFAMVAMLFALGLAIRGFHGVESPAFARSFGALFAGFMPGVGLAVLELWLPPRLVRINWSRWLAIGAGLAGLGLMLWLSGTNPREPWVQVALGSIAAGLVLGGPLVLQWGDGGAWRVLDNRLLHFVGERSYGLFIIHLAVMVELGTLAAKTGGYKWTLLFLFPTTLIISMVLADLSLRFVERPCLRRTVKTQPEEPTPGLAPAI
jgi:peptidoglycan/LPS O-acetylase OafA/YrhL